MPKLTKAQMVANLKKNGVEASEDWTVKQLEEETSVYREHGVERAVTQEDLDNDKDAKLAGKNVGDAATFDWVAGEGESDGAVVKDESGEEGGEAKGDPTGRTGKVKDVVSTDKVLPVAAAKVEGKPDDKTKVTVKSNVNHDRKDYKAGDVVEMKVSEANALIEAGVAEKK